jgi:hypothetical protein
MVCDEAFLNRFTTCFVCWKFNPKLNPNNVGGTARLTEDIGMTQSDRHRLFTEFDLAFGPLNVDVQACESLTTISEVVECLLSNAVALQPGYELERQEHWKKWNSNASA